MILMSCIPKESRSTQKPHHLDIGPKSESNLQSYSISAQGLQYQLHVAHVATSEGVQNLLALKTFHSSRITPPSVPLSQKKKLDLPGSGLYGLQYLSMAA
jgi:cytochrome oxidase assembly protein ShyY1